MAINTFRCGIDEIKYINDAIGSVKDEEDSCFFNKRAIKKFLLNDDNWFYVATIDEKVVAYAIAYVQRRLDTMKNMICLYEIGTLKCYRKMGLAKRIINKIIEDGKLNDVMKIWIPTNMSNEAACALYRSIGAEEPEIKDEIIYNYRY
ncbi:GNAT family N-acetyltransferase [Haloimpatiens massiliensis]|uniref:GNAT family N-acetyltransferase n=1 Tax=Haloimpatiens massiliensis TaxID=1658110 RepID=UPI0015E0BA4D|nr:GNAT family N-acetyltransferase [Haloimpatiens massiliensis]